MQKRTLAKRIAAGFLTGLVSAALLTGCGGSSGKPSGGSGAANNPPKIEVPTRAPVSTAPTMTFKFGETEAKVYELTGVDLKDIIRSGKIVTLGDDIFFHTDTKHYEDKVQHMNKVTMKNETISNLVDLGPSGDISELTTNGKTVVWQSSRKATDGKDKLMIYDGKEANVAGKWSGSPAGDPDSDKFYVLWGHELREQHLENGEWKIDKKLIEDCQKIDPEFGRVAFKNVCVSKGEIYIRYFLPKKDGEKNDTPMLIAFDKSGKELRRYEGVKELPRGWAVTENYVIATGSQGVFRVYERKTAKLLGEAKVDKLRPFALWTSKGNDVILYDDRAKKLYRVDF